MQLPSWHIWVRLQNTAIALEGLREKLSWCVPQLVKDALQAAKNKLLGQYALGKQTNAQIAQMFGWYETLGWALSLIPNFSKKLLV